MAGRKKLPEGIAQEPFSVTLPPWLIKWFNKQGKPRSKMLEEMAREKGARPPWEKNASKK